MPNDELPGLHRVNIKRPGKEPLVYFYAWRGGPRIQSEPGTPEFRQEFELLHKREAGERRAAAAKTLNLIFDGYQDSPNFRNDIAPRTRRDYAGILDVLRREFGAMPLTVLDAKGTRAKFLDWRDEYGEDSARQADYRWSVLNIAVNWAVGREMVDRNPFSNAGKLYNADRSDKVWSAEQIRALLSVAPAHVALPFLLALYTAQRQGDLLRLTWRQYDGERISLRQGKTGMYVSVRLATPAKAALDAARDALPEPPAADAHILLTARGGDPWTEDGFRASWGKVKRDDARIVGRTFHDLRGTAVTMLAMAGCSEAEIATISGHSLKDVRSILDKHYLHRDTRLADSGIAKLDAMVAAFAAPANDVEIGTARPQRQANGFTGTKLAAKRAAEDAA